jgi:hypothetical protein
MMMRREKQDGKKINNGRQKEAKNERVSILHEGAGRKSTTANLRREKT